MLASKDDIGVIMRMCKSFFDASGYNEEIEFNEEDMKAVIEELIEKKSLVTDGENGMLGFIVFPVFMNHSHLIAQELFWWVDEDKRGGKLGLELLREAESQAKKLGAKSLLMLSLSKLNGDKVNALYESKGYKPREVTYMRSL